MLPLYHHALPQLSGSLFLTDAGLETDLVFNRGIAIHALNLSTRLTGEAEPGADATMVYTLTSTANRTAGFAPEQRPAQQWRDCASASLRRLNVEG